MTNAQIEYLKHKETQAHNREMERQGREDVASRRLQAEASGSQAQSAAASVPAQYLRSLLGTGAAGLILKGAESIGKARQATREANRMARYAEAVSGVTGAAKKTMSVKSLISAIKTGLSKAQPGIFVDYNAVAKGLRDHMEIQTALGEWVRENPHATSEEYEAKLKELKLFVTRKEDNHENKN